MSNPDAVITVENLGKSYLLGQRGASTERYTALRDVVMNKAKELARSALGRGRTPAQRACAEEFWALRNVSFQIRKGEVVGIIGRNGAGKSTLLKVLSRITEPTEGCARISGRVASLLEVGTGFHPELTGRENIFLNGAILGMSRREIKTRFDEIVEFAEVGKFLDTPVKRYSSGMYVRLAFAVAAHLEPEILVVDEVLAVGDAGFQKKCLGKMKDVASQGRTVLFVSHQMGAVQRLTSRCLLLRSGEIAFDGPTNTAIDQYVNLGATAEYGWDPGFRKARQEPHFIKAFLCNEDGSPCSTPTSAGTFGVQIEYVIPEEVGSLLLSVDLLSESEQILFVSSPIDSDRCIPSRPGFYRARVMFPKSILMPRQFSVGMTLYRGNHIFDKGMPAFGFRVEEVASLANKVSNRRAGEFQVLCDWAEIEKLD
ncbi:MAG TPA: ABC transporter ATP-binding protein [Chthoniobacteraceae bacterium]|nr:ABC transporter ATP-binding protein [Chthoniobacteraceae bacterium]